MLPLPSPYSRQATSIRALASAGSPGAGKPQRIWLAGCLQHPGRRNLLVLPSAPDQAPLPSPSPVPLHVSPSQFSSERGYSCGSTDTKADLALPCDTLLVWLSLGGSAYLRWLEELVQFLLRSALGSRSSVEQSTAESSSPVAVPGEKLFLSCCLPNSSAGNGLESQRNTAPPGGNGARQNQALNRHGNTCLLPDP